MKINKKSNNKYDVTFSTVLNIIMRCRRKDGMNRKSLSKRIKRKVLSTLSPPTEVSGFSELFRLCSLTITSYMLMTTIMESKILKMLLMYL